MTWYTEGYAIELASVQLERKEPATDKRCGRVKETRNPFGRIGGVRGPTWSDLFLGIHGSPEVEVFRQVVDDGKKMRHTTCSGGTSYPLPKLLHEDGEIIWRVIFRSYRTSHQCVGTWTKSYLCLWSC